MPNEFSLIGSTGAPAVPAGFMTEGLGHPLHPVDDSGSVSREETTIFMQSLVTQEPAIVDTVLQLNYGDAQASDFIDVDALGNITALVSGQFTFSIRAAFGRAASAGEAIIFARVLIDDVQIGNTVSVRIDDSSTVIPLSFNFFFDLLEGQVVTTELYRDSEGVNEGGVFTEPAALAGWTDSPSMQLIIDRFV